MVALLKGLLKPFEVWNDLILPVGRAIAIVLVALMVVAILVQVFFRYVLDNPLPWPDEAARFCMLWMTGLIAPMAYRRGGFVAIDTPVQALPARVAATISFVLLLIAAFVLGFAVKIGYGEITGFNARFATASLYVPTAVDFSEWMKVPRWWMSASLFVGVILLFIVNVELIIRTLITILGGGDQLKSLAPADDVVAE